MGEDRAIGLLILLFVLPGAAWTLSDYRRGVARMALGSRRRQPAVAERATDPRLFRRYLGANVALFAALTLVGLWFLVQP